MDIMTGLLPAGGTAPSADRILVYNLSLVIRNKCRGGAVSAPPALIGV